MKRQSILYVLILSAVLIFTGCARNSGDSGFDGDPVGNDPVPAEQGTLAEEVSGQDAEEDTAWDKIPMVRINGKLYYDTGKESTVDLRCGMMDGEITSTVDGTEIPTQENQSNFGTGFGYQCGPDDTIEIFMNDKWIVFECREDTGSQADSPEGSQPIGTQDADVSATGD